MNNLSNLAELKKIQLALHENLESLTSFKDCAIIDWPKHYNLGDHLIWLGNIFYLANTAHFRISYATSLDNFSEAELEKKAPQAPILLHGGGNFGDFWPRSQKFREKIISKYHDRPIVILPQSLYFKEQENLEKTTAIFNQHPNLTLFLRDDYSYEIAKQFFTNCRVAKAPDLAFELVDIPNRSLPIKRNNSILYLYRKDRENNTDFSPTALNISNLVVEDWRSYDWMTVLPKEWVYIPGLVRLIRDGWQRGLSIPQEWLSRQKWELFHPSTKLFSSLDNSSIHRMSWSMMHTGIYQLSQYSLVITNRLHVHILCSLLDIPHIFLPGAYYKNEVFYKTWTYQLPLVRFVKNPAEIKPAIDELRDYVANG
ncbi:polysaccharide pyruvyl transferase family protein [Chroococcus sp. FPU101]|uniref:polysaccharide pyruvyl transferase family protein n=1 Tax=Chroococcus sp. FPU101 TaxID=1974212 RepID=UPI001A8C2BE5|nr:polysaccharide pyruvyl transferase family protein [Chroococcus sp. FPU101]GFE67701.1 polysaccharide pyruvyl transferase [Chroococcus sp. FPU101]